MEYDTRKRSGTKYVPEATEQKGARTPEKD
jgi:hypothetical protein